MDSIQIKKLLPMLMTAVIWDINFRLTFKNMDCHMDLGCYPSLKYDPLVILIKNISCFIIFLFIYFFSKKLNDSEKKPDKLLTIKTEGSSIIYQYERQKKLFLGSLIIYHKLNTKTKKILFCIKIILLILVIYICEEIYFIIGSNHILDRVIVPLRNLAIIVTIFIFSSLLIKKRFKLHKHQLIPILIVIGSSLFIILFNALTVIRFKKIYNINFFYYMLVYVLMGIEIVLIKYLTDIQFIDPLLILAMKGFFGSIIFIIINIYFNGDKLFYFIDEIMTFEYDNIYEDFIIAQKIFYIITTIIVQYIL